MIQNSLIKSERNEFVIKINLCSIIIIIGFSYENAKISRLCNVYRKIIKYRYRTDNKAPEILIFNLLFTNQSSNLFIGAI